MRLAEMIVKNGNCMLPMILGWARILCIIFLYLDHSAPHVGGSESGVRRGGLSRWLLHPGIIMLRYV